MFILYHDSDLQHNLLEVEAGEDLYMSFAHDATYYFC